MSSATENSKTTGPVRHSRRPRWALRLAIAFILAVFLGSMIQNRLQGPRKNELALRGTLRIQTPAGAKIYLGNTLLDSSTAEFTWDEVFGTAQSRPLAIPLPPDTPPPDSPPHGGLTAAALAGTRATILWSKAKISTSTGFANTRFHYTWREVVIRRQNGELDSLIVMDGRFSRTESQWKRFFLPFRIRHTSADTTPPYFSTQRASARSRPGTVIFARFSNPTIDVTLNVSERPAPGEFIQEINENGFWSPPN